MNNDTTGTRALRSLDPRRLLASTCVYRLVQHALVPRRSFESFVADHVRPRPGDRVLDVGCGPADDLEFMPDVTYVGFDLNEQYIESARRRWGDRGRFFCANVSSAVLEGEVFDIVVANGVLHHLGDAAAQSLVRLAAAVLTAGGRLVTKDPTCIEDQSTLARAMVRMDRGGFVRTPSRYRDLLRTGFQLTSVTIRHDLLRVPYTHAVLEASNYLHLPRA